MQIEMCGRSQHYLLLRISINSKIILGLDKTIRINKKIFFGLCLTACVCLYIDGEDISFILMLLGV